MTAASLSPSEDATLTISHYSQVGEALLKFIVDITNRDDIVFGDIIGVSEFRQVILSDLCAWG